MEKAVRDLIEEYGLIFSASLGIDLKSGREEEIFKWFLASILFGKRISRKIASRTYKEFEARGILTAEKILETGWDRLVTTLDEGGYVRYDFSTATMLLETMKKLLNDYGTLTALHHKAINQRDLENRLTDFKGIGPVTANIFLREMRTTWQKADPKPLEFVRNEAEILGISLEPYNRKTEDFILLESALIRHSKSRQHKRTRSDRPVDR